MPKLLTIIVLSMLLSTSAKALTNDKDSLRLYNFSEETPFENKPLIRNLTARFMLRSQFLADITKSQTSTNFQAKPAMIALSFDMGDKFAFYSRYRFDFPTTIQADGTPVSLLAFNLQYKPTDKIRLVAGKQMMLQGSWEFEYCPIDVFNYSLFGNYIQGFVTGLSAYYTQGEQQLALQVSKVVDDAYIWNNDKNAWNATAYYFGEWGGGFYKPIWSTTYTYAGGGKHLYNVMMGNQFRFGRLLVDLDLMSQTSFGTYQIGEERNRVQRRVNEYSCTTYAAYLLPGDKFMLGAKCALDKRALTVGGSDVTAQKTFSMELRYKLSEKYGVTLHGMGAYRLNSTPEPFRASFSNENETILAAGFVWDFTLKK